MAVTYTKVHGTPYWSNSNTTGAALSVTVSPTSIGDIMIAAVANQGGTSVQSLSGGGVTTWTRVGSPWTDPETTPTVLEWWIGTVTSTGSSSISVTWNAAVGSHFNEITVQDFHATGGTGVWAAEANGNITNASSGTVNYPVLAATNGPEIYMGYASTPSAISTSSPSPAGFVQGLSNANNCVISGTTYTGTAVSHSVSLSEASWAIGITVYQPTLAVAAGWPPQRSRLIRPAASYRRRLTPVVNPVPPYPGYLWNSGDGGPAGTLITSGASGNTGGVSGNPFDSVTNGGTGAVFQADTTHLLHGHQNYQVATGSTAIQCFAIWSTQLGLPAVYWPTMWFRFYFWPTALPGTNARIFAPFDAGANICAAVRFDTNGFIRITNQGNAQTGSSAGAIPLNAWTRIEGSVTPGGQNGTMAVQLYTSNIEGTTPDDQIALNAANYGQQLGQARWGQSAGSVANYGPFWLAELAISNTGPIGPWVAPQVYPVASLSYTPGTAFAIRHSTSAGDGIVVLTDSASGVPTGVTDTQGNTYVLQASGGGNSIWTATYKGSPGTATAALTAGTDTITVAGGVSGAVIAAGAKSIAAQLPDFAAYTSQGTLTVPAGPQATGLSGTDLILWGLCGGTAMAAAPCSLLPGLFDEVSNAFGGGGGEVLAWAPSGVPVIPSALLTSALAASTFTVALAPAPSVTAISLADVAAAADVARLKMESLTDNFPGSSVDATKWTAYNSPTVASNTLTCTDTANSTNYSGISSLAFYDLTGSYFLAHITNGGNQYASTQAMIVVANAGNTNSAAVIVNNGNLLAQHQVGGSYTTLASITWVPATMSWLRLHESGGTLYYEYSADGLTWTTLWSEADPFALTALQATVQEGAYTTSDPQATSTWQSVNLPPTGATPALADPAGAVEASSVSAAVPVADVGAGTEAAVIAAAVPLAEVAAGREALVNPAAVPVAEVAGAAEALAITVTVPLAEVAGSAEYTPRELVEAAGASEALAVTATVPLSDAAAGAESQTASASLAVTDAAAAADQLSVSATASLVESGAGADGVATSVTLPLAETAGSTDSLLSGQPTALAEVAAGADAITVPAETIALADSAAATEAIPIAETSGLPEAAGAAEALAVSVAVPLAEAGAGAEVLTAAVPVALADQAAAVEYSPRELVEAAGAAENISETVTAPLAESAGAADALSWTGAVSAADTGAASDTLAVAATVGLPEIGAAGDTPAVTASAALAETAGGAEGITLAGTSNPQFTEAAGGAEALTATVTTAAADQAGAADAFSTGQGASPALADSAGAADTLAVAAAAAVAFSEAGAALEIAAAVAASPAADTAGAAESAAITTTTPLPDQSAASEALGASVSAPAAETAASADQLGIAAQARPVDAAGASEALGVSKPFVPLAEAAAAAETFSVHIQLSFGPEPVWSVDAADPAWMAHPAAAAWAVEIAAPVWTASGQQGQWAASVALARWRIDMAVFEPIAAVSLEHINARWTSDLDGTVTDPTVGPMTVQFAFPASSGDENHPAAPATWYPGVWVPPNGSAKGFLAQCLVGPSGGVVALTAGHYDVWSKVITSGSEQPAKFVGVQAVY